ncbi:beta-galactosidase 16-like [Cucurbita maxima]|uniref:beta-galactosidase n=1 Tax=Cucurbita maxima TaxID=3661 RepID=A0A6J1JT08_CUCMA|nr:beta-galactosidase 16-like [Cucurbita maxima]
MAASHAKLHHEDSEHDEVGRLICFTGRANYTFTHRFEPVGNTTNGPPLTPLYFHSFKKTHQWSCRLRMNTRWWRHPFMRKDHIMLNGQKTWRLAFRLVCHGPCTGVPWTMCKQDDAPDPVINACNGLECGETFVGPNSPNKPSIWTENWISNYQIYGDEPYLRSAEDIAFHVVLFIAAKNGAFVNYHMYHGGTNFGRSTAEYVITGYYDQAPLDEYGLTREPKWSHLKELHAAVKLCTKPLLSGTKSIISLGQLQNTIMFKTESGECAAFLVNRGAEDVSVLFQEVTYEFPSSSISILPDCKTVAFNTKRVSVQYNTRTMKAVSCPSLIEAGIVCADRQAVDTFISSAKGVKQWKINQTEKNQPQEHTVSEHRYRGPKGQEIAYRESGKFSGNLWQLSEAELQAYDR